MPEPKRVAVSIEPQVRMLGASSWDELLEGPGGPGKGHKGAPAILKLESFRSVPVFSLLSLPPHITDLPVGPIQPPLPYWACVQSQPAILILPPFSSLLALPPPHRALYRQPQRGDIDARPWLPVLNPWPLCLCCSCGRIRCLATADDAGAPLVKGGWNEQREGPGDKSRCTERAQMGQSCSPGRPKRGSWFWFHAAGCVVLTNFCG